MTHYDFTQAKRSDGTIVVRGTDGHNITVVEATINGRQLLIPVESLKGVPFVPSEAVEGINGVVLKRVTDTWMHPATPIVIGVSIFLIGLGAYALAKATTQPLPVATPAPEPRVIVVPQPAAPAAPSNQRCLLACF